MHWIQIWVVQTYSRIILISLIFAGSITGSVIINEFDQTLRSCSLEKKALFAVTDNGSNMISAFKLELPGFDLAPSEVDETFVNELLAAEVQAATFLDEGVYWRYHYYCNDVPRQKNIADF